MKKTISSFDLAYILNMNIDVLEDMLDGNNLHTEDDVYSLDLPCDAKQRLDLHFDSQPKVLGKQRKDIQGFLYDLQPKTVTVKPKSVWERDDYIPFLDEAKAWIPVEFTDRELVDCTERLSWDIEIYKNYCLIAFEGIESGKQCFIELSPFHGKPNYRKLQYIFNNKQLISFNGINFDSIIASLFINEKSNDDLQQATSMIIDQEIRGYNVLKHFNVRKVNIDQIDIMELCIGKNSLKLYGARLHCNSIIDLPFKPGSTLCKDKMLVTKYYCANDLSVTKLVYLDRLDAVRLRESITTEYKFDAKSKSDAQCAEHMIMSEYKNLTGNLPVKSKFEVISFKYQVPSYINFKTKELNNILDIFRNSEITTTYSGKMECKELENLTVTIGNSTYKVKLGGIHTAEESVTYYANDENEMMIVDSDVQSYYPKIIINQQLSPENLGSAFLNLYENKIFYPRLEAKKNKDKMKDAMFKTCLNGSFGKYNSKFSVLYSPRLLVQVTVSGQLSLLMLIERLELAGISVISANTDGEVMCYHKSRHEEVLSIIKKWETHCNFIMEQTYYSQLSSRDINNYIAIKTNGDVKLKGTYAEVNIGKNPINTICNEAVVAYLTEKIPVENTVNKSDDIRKFLTLRNVKGGAYKDNVYLGKTVRYYHSNSTNSPIVYANSGNVVPMSDRCRALQKLPNVIPCDVDRIWYIEECYRILRDIGVKYE